jgi:hypothetical protein
MLALNPDRMQIGQVGKDIVTVGPLQRLAQRDVAQPSVVRLAVDGAIIGIDADLGLHDIEASVHLGQDAGLVEMRHQNAEIQDFQTYDPIWLFSIIVNQNVTMLSTAHDRWRLFNNDIQDVLFDEVTDV